MATKKYNHKGSAVPAYDCHLEQLLFRGIAERKPCNHDEFGLTNLTVKGNLKEILDICNAHPEQILVRDPTGASMLHHAAAHGKIRVMDFVLDDQDGFSLLDAVDETGATPLHWAATYDNGPAMEYLLSKGANHGLRNSNSECPLHTCMRKNGMTALRAIIKYKKSVDLNQTTSTGETAMHLAAISDNVEAFQLLFEAEASPCVPCKQGLRPLHAAAFNGSINVMKYIMGMIESRGYTVSEMLSFSDNEQCSVLHAAVSGGNFQAVKLCLEYKAQLDSQQVDLTTPMHVVCSQGAFEILELMFEKSPDQALRTMAIQDNLEQSPLHKSAIYGHVNIIDYLLKMGADIDLKDVDQNTPLLLASSRGNWDCARTLIKLGADICIKNKDERQFMHMVVLNGGDIRNLDLRMLSEASVEICKNKQMLNEEDSFGCTPLQYACREGNLASLETLMTWGVNARHKSTGNHSALHFAAMCGRYNACKRLLNSSQGPNIINERDDWGMTALHLAAENGHVKVVKLLLNKGAVLHRNIAGETVLHVAASNGYTKTIRMLLNMNKTLIDEADDKGDTPLHQAARARQINTVRTLLDLNASILFNNESYTFFTEAILNINREVALCAVEHDRWEEVMQAVCKIADVIRIPAHLLIIHLPDIWVVAMDRCIQTSDYNPKSPDYWVKYQFKYLQPRLEDRKEIKKVMNMKVKDTANGYVLTEGVGKQGLAITALPALNKMVQYNRVECLRHPVSLAYIRMKWNGYGRWFHGINLFVYILNLIPLTYLICSTDSSMHNDVRGSATNYTQKITEPVEISRIQFSMMILLTILSCGQMIKEIVQMFQQRGKYFTSFINLIEWIIYISTLLYVVPFYSAYPVHWQFEFGAIAVLYSWINLLLFLQRFSKSGIYVVMFIEILRTLIRVLAVFSILIIAFSLSFYVLMNNEPDKVFSDPALSIMAVVTMLLGEIGYVELFLNPYVDGNADTLHFPTVAMLLLALFIIIMPILLMNLLIGLAVGDIAQVQNNAALERLAMQVQLHTQIEGKLSLKILKLVDKDEVIDFPNRTCTRMDKLFGYSSANEDNPEKYGATEMPVRDRNIKYLQAEIQKQKDRVKDIQNLLEKQHDLLRLIVRKMEIRSEEHDQDEGNHPDLQRQQQRRRRLTMSSVGAKLLAVNALSTATRK